MSHTLLGEAGLRKPVLFTNLRKRAVIHLWKRLYEDGHTLGLSLALTQAEVAEMLEALEENDCVCWLFIFKDTEPSPLQDSFSVRQQGGLPGPPPRSLPPRIHRRPGGLPLTAQHYCPVVSGPNCFQALGSSPGLPQSPML